MHKLIRLTGALALMALAACAQKPATQAPPPVMPVMVDPGTGQPVISGPVLQGTAPRTPGKTSGTSSIGEGAALSVAQLDRASQAERAQAAAAPSGGERRLGTTVASLGDPSLPGFWVKTPLVDAESAGRVVNPATGKSSKVRLIPLGGPPGGGSQVSLSTLQMLGASLTDLPTLELFQG
ncbi:MAG: hypothetical protein QM682_08575 [Paracoccus sp. (in: a-proteobacteria)]|uniref:hypothetical protein n=1 Tax=Paracoccus sp. TaxID=267 RepID=UPI0039E59D57